MDALATDHPKQAQEQWETVERCPACGSNDRAPHGVIPDRRYVFGAEVVPIPDAGIAVFECRRCGLVYKATVPTPSFLAAVFSRQAAAKWGASRDFSFEAATLRRLAGGSAFDVLDVGAADGALLKACAESGVTGRRSALDVLRYPGIDAHLSGEFIEGFLDAPSLVWSNEPYGVVTLFDVLEHLYQPQIAFSNLRSLVEQGGLVVMETGNTDNFWPQHFGICQWWYVRLFEHHVFWTRRPLERIAALFGFKIVFWEERRHKSRREASFPGIGNNLVKTGLYCVSAESYSAIARLLGRQGSQPWYPFTRDHVQVCLKKK